MVCCMIYGEGCSQYNKRYLRNIERSHNCNSLDWLEFGDVIELPMTPRFGLFTFASSAI